MNHTINNHRRNLLKGATAATIGYALATQPINAQTIHTSDDGLTTQDIQLPTYDGTLHAFIAKPKQSNNALPVILLVSEIFGVHEYIRDVARRLAKQGYLVIAPALFTRQGDPSKISDIPTIQKEVISKVPDEQVMKDLDACVAWAEKNNGNIKSLGITGFCWGGRTTWLYSSHNKHIKAGVAWYGRLIGNKTQLTPEHPLDLAEKLHAPVLGLYAEKDAGISLDSVTLMQTALKNAKQNAFANKSQLIVYPNVQHGFHADYRPSYQAEAASQAWEQMTKWFKQYL